MVQVRLFIDQPHDVRSSERRPAQTDATLRVAPPIPHDVTVRDVSAGGAAIETSLSLAIGTRLSIGIPGIPIRRGHVVRRMKNGYGIAFDAPISDVDIANAGVDTIASFSGVAALDLPEPDVRPWPAAARLGLILGLAGGLWAGIFLLIF